LGLVRGFDEDEYGLDGGCEAGRCMAGENCCSVEPGSYAATAGGGE
jgi:hypothetical protein